MNNFNIDENTVNKLKDMMNKGELSDVISQIPPEMIQNFSSMMGQNNNNNSQNQNYNTGNQSSTETSNNSSFDFSNIDMNTIIKMTSVMNNLNNTNDPRSNLLKSLKPYMRDSKKDKVDQYANLLNIAKVAELLKNDTSNKESPNNG